HPVDTHLLAHRKVDANVVEQCARRPREVVPVGRQALDRLLAPPQQPLPIRSRVVSSVLDDGRRQPPVDRATELIHLTALPSPRVMQVVLPFCCFLSWKRGGLSHPSVKPQRSHC